MSMECVLRTEYGLESGVMGLGCPNREAILDKRTDQERMKEKEKSHTKSRTNEPRQKKEKKEGQRPAGRQSPGFLDRLSLSPSQKVPSDPPFPSWLDWDWC